MSATPRLRALRNFGWIRNVANGFDYNLDTSLNDPFVDLVKAAQAFGIEAFYVNKPSELASVLEYALGIDGPALVNVHIAR
ncbi:thiamine pyrophosphate-dependent enzyme [Moorella stamsii]|uniref:thiamine pyrophosphate-dependent enzyme n=1 Tax=Neomoorella stamsii TaxID=1266720 RepID=UPI0009F9B406